MPLNDAQKTYRNAVEAGDVPAETVFSDLSEIDSAAYQQPSFRSLLFALDALQCLQGPKWYQIFVSGLTERSDWLEDRLLGPRVFVEIEKNHEAFGRGEYGLEVVIDLIDQARRYPSNADSFARRCVREYFNGIQPVSEHALFVLKKYIETRMPLDERDINLMLHIRQETKGLDNVTSFDRFFAKAISNSVTRKGAVDGQKRQSQVIEFLGSRREITDAERALIRMLRDHQVVVPAPILKHIDLAREKLLGLA